MQVCIYESCKILCILICEVKMKDFLYFVHPILSIGYCLLFSYSIRSNLNIIYKRYFDTKVNVDLIFYQ